MISEFLLFALTALGFIAYVWKIAAKTSKISNKLSPKTLEKFSQLPSFPLIGPALHVFPHRNDLDTLVKKWRKIYGPCWRTRIFGRNILFVHDPMLLKSILSSKDIGHLEKPPLVYKSLILGVGFKGIFSRPAEGWAERRKALNPLFTYESLKSYIPIYQKHGNEIVNKLMISNDQDIKSSYVSLVHIKTLDIITEILTGYSFESKLGHLGAMKFYEDLEIMMTIAVEKFACKPWQFIPFIWYFDPLRKKQEKHLTDFENAVRKIQKLHVPKPDSKFALDFMINSNWSEDEITAEMVTLIVGGHDTVSSNFVLHLWLLAVEQEHQIACQQETDQVFDALESSGEEMTLGCLSGLKYLERCVKESLRLFPSTPFGTNRELKSSLKLDNDVTLEPGTIVTYSTYVLHRDPEVFPNPEKFDPDRFLPENVKSRHLFSYLPFSAGPRNCLGWKSALSELTVLSAVILRTFHLRTTDTREDIKPVFKFTIHPSREPNIVFEKRR